MNIDYNDQRFQQVNNEKQQKLNEVNNTYNNMINQSDQYYNNLAKEAEAYGNKQQELQQQRTDLEIEKIEKQKAWAKEDYTNEQKGAYQDYMKQTDKYGANAERMAQNGLLGTGYSETSKVNMYNAYQNRVATARTSFNRAIQDYDLAIKDAQQSNNSVLAELAHNTLQTKLELALQGFQYKNDLIKTKLNEVNRLEDSYYSRWNDVLQQINKEKAFEYQKERDRIADEQYAQSLAARYSGGGNNGSYPYGDDPEALGTSGSWFQNAANKALNAANSKKKNNGTISAVMTPSLSTKNYGWYNQNFSKSMSLDALNSAIAKGLSSGNLKDSDVNKIYKAYQLM